MAQYTGLDKRIEYLFEHGGGGGGSGSFLCDLLFENTNLTPASGTSDITKTYTLNGSIDDYDAAVILAYMYNYSSNHDQLNVFFIPHDSFYEVGSSVNSAYLMNGAYSTRRLFFSFSNASTLLTKTGTRVNDEEPILYKVYGLKLGGSGHIFSTTEKVIGTWTDGKPIYECCFINNLANGLQLTSQQWTATDISNAGMETVVDCRVISPQGAVYNFVAAAADTGNTVIVLQTRNSNIYARTIILQYTKSTD